MGEWVIHIEGHGIHDNGRSDDVDAQLVEFVKKLRETHDIKSATLTIGSAREVILHGDETLLGHRIKGF